MYHNNKTNYRQTTRTKLFLFSGLVIFFLGVGALIYVVNKPKTATGNEILQQSTWQTATANLSTTW